MLNKALLTFISITCALLLSACGSPINYSNDYESSTNFSNLKTYAWHAPNEHNDKTKKYLSNDIIEARITKGIELDLQSKGMQKVDAAKADFLINYTVTTEERLDFKTYNTYSGFSTGWGSSYYGYGHGYGYRSSRYSGMAPYGYYGMSYAPVATESRTEAVPYKIGTLVIDIVKTKNDKLIWRGTAQGRLKKPNNKTPKEKEEKLSEVITNTLMHFPPKKKQAK